MSRDEFRKELLIPFPFIEHKIRPGTCTPYCALPYKGSNIPIIIGSQEEQKTPVIDHIEALVIPANTLK